MPHSDALSYFGATFDLAFSGHWNTQASWRPLAAAFRELTVFAGGFSYIGTHLVQAVLMTGAFMLTLRSAMAWRGIWVAMALMALLYALVRPFLLTTMTEPLGLVWSLFSLSFFIEVFRQRSVNIAVVAFAALVCGLLTRMGSMLTIPFLMIWIALWLADQRGPRIRILAALAGVLLVLSVYNVLLGHVFSPPNIHLGGNFSQSACVLALGGEWDECLRLFDSAAQESRIADVDQFFYGEAARAFITHPTASVTYMVSNMWRDVYTLPDLPVFQYLYANCAYL